jgi:transcription initiation factor IIE alpha subunit
MPLTERQIAEKAARRKIILDMIREKGSVTSSEIKTVLGCTGSQAGGYLSHLVRDGILSNEWIGRDENWNLVSRYTIAGQAIPTIRQCDTKTVRQITPLDHHPDIPQEWRKRPSVIHLM